MPTLLLLVLAAVSVAAGPATSEPPQPRLESLAWLAGHWVASSEDTKIEELWLPPAGGLMLGLHRKVTPSGQAFFEYLRIETTDAGIDYVASPGGGPSTPFRLTSTKKTEALFVNPEHDFPQRIIYRRTGETLRARIEADTDEGVESREWTYRRAPAGRD